ncbi:ABC transporter permease [Melghirimyces algeriensis]|uniref:Fluoroquinolone transport system permease protein n=1 Tax=Melghirimyces algeriensis TaxID=910412 RepID=A0A521ABG8_9BACL|nr:ABC transporter permease [Melghirimyces algeriensis]SMO32128.1 fluoroquinolone transport system permease protein [Melghirimyces algeriensis]
MYASFMLSEAKKWIRDSMTAFMLLYPLLFGIIGRWVIPWLTDTTGLNLDPYMDIVLAALTIMAAHIYGALVGFSILDDRDDHIFHSIQVTPLPIYQFVSFRLGLAMLLSFATGIYIPLFSNLIPLSWGEVILISAIASFSAPLVGLLMNAFAKNKMEGFAVMKGIVAILIIFPIASLFFTDAKEWFFAFAPGFWPAKAMSSIVRGDEGQTIGFYGYILLGLGYVLLLNMLVYTWFQKKTLQ